jgi:hypothetical protein
MFMCVLLYLYNFSLNFSTRIELALKLTSIALKLLRKMKHIIIIGFIAFIYILPLSNTQKLFCLLPMCMCPSFVCLRVCLIGWFFARNSFKTSF